MKTLFKLLAGLVGVVVLAVVGLLGYLFTAFPKVGPAKELKIHSTPELVERGKYLANHVAVCIDCHSYRDVSHLSAPVVPGSEGQGGIHFDLGAGGYLIAANITPAALSGMTDGELFRTITTGVKKDGTPIFPLMPYMNYGVSDPEDIQAIIAYIRTLAPNPNKPASSHLNFPLSLIVRTIPQESKPGKRPSPSDVQAYGKYLVTLASCSDCHTPMDDKGNRVPGMEFAGGMEFNDFPGGIMRSANITPDPETGIGAWDKQAFFQRFRAFSDPSTQPAVAEGQFNTVMPWTMYAGMTDEDLGAIYEYLHARPPVKHKVEHFTPNAKS